MVNLEYGMEHYFSIFLQMLYPYGVENAFGPLRVSLKKYPEAACKAMNHFNAQLHPLLHFMHPKPICYA